MALEVQYFTNQIHSHATPNSFHATPNSFNAIPNSFHATKNYFLNFLFLVLTFAIIGSQKSNKISKKNIT